MHILCNVEAEVGMEGSLVSLTAFTVFVIAVNIPVRMAGIEVRADVIRMRDFIV